MIALLRRHRDLRLLFVAQVISYLGDWFAFVALAGLVDDATGSEFLVSLVLVAFSLPSFLMSPVGGSFADRVDRRRLLVGVSVFQAAAAAGLLLASPSRIWAVFVFQGLVSAFAAFVRPAVEAAVPNLVDNPDELRQANGLLGATWGVMLAVGAALGGLFSEVFGRQPAIIVNAISFVAAAAVFAAIRTPLQRHTVSGDSRSAVRPIADMREAIGFARRDPVVLALMASKSTFGIGTGVVSQLAVLASDVFAAGDGGRGLLIGARGVGAGLGPLIAARFVGGRLNRVLLVCGWSGIAFSVLYVGASWAPSIGLAALAVVVAHLGGGAQWTLSSYGLQLRSPDEVRGRVMAGDFAIVTLVISVASVTAGLLAQSLGVQWAITLCAGAAGIGGAVYLTATKAMRHRLALEQA